MSVVMPPGCDFSNCSPQNVCYCGGNVTNSCVSLTSCTYTLFSGKVSSNGTIQVLASWTGSCKIDLVVNDNNIDLTNGQPYSVNVQSGNSISIRQIVWMSFGSNSCTANWGIYSTANMSSPNAPTNLETYILIVLIIIVAAILLYGFFKYAVPSVSKAVEGVAPVALLA